MPKPPPRLSEAHGLGRVRGQAQRELVGLELRLADRLGAQVLRAREQVEALELEAGRGDGVQHVGHLLDVDAELLGAAAHLHARALQFEVRVHAHGHARGDAQLRADVRQQMNLAHRLDVQQHPRGDGLAQFRFALAGAREADLARIGAGVQRHLQLAGGSHVDAVDQLRHEAHDGRHRIGLHRVVQPDAGGQRRAKLVDAPAQQAAVVGEERRLADALGQTSTAPRRRRAIGRRKRRTASSGRGAARRARSPGVASATPSSRLAGVAGPGDPFGRQQLAVDLAVGIAWQRPDAHLDARRHHVGGHAGAALRLQAAMSTLSRRPVRSRSPGSPGRGRRAGRRRPRTRPRAASRRELSSTSAGLTR